MENHIDWIGVLALIAGVIALVVAVFGIYDVRKLMRELTLLERNRSWARVLYRSVEQQYVDLRSELAGPKSEMHEFTMLVRALEPEIPLDIVQSYANHEIIYLAREMVKVGLAKWKPTIDEQRIDEALKSWQEDKYTAILKNMFGSSLTSLKGDPRKKMIRN